MDAKKVTEIRDKLQEIRIELIGGVEKKLKSSQEESGQVIADISDEAARNYNSQLMLNLGEQDWEKLRMVDEALEKLAKGGYGACQQCEKPIPEARLKIIPFTKYCVVCLNEIEKEKALEKHQSI